MSQRSRRSPGLPFSDLHRHYFPSDVPMSRGPEGVEESSRIAVYSAPWGFIWSTNVALFVGEADMEAIALSGVTG